MELSQVMEKIETAPGRPEKIEEELFLEGFSKELFFDRIDNH